MEFTYSPSDIEKVVESFVAFNIYQPKLSKPMSCDGWIVATNTHAVAIVPKTAVSKEYDEMDPTITVIRPILDRTRETENVSVGIRVHDLIKSIETIETYHRQVPDKKCQNCKGEWSLTCEYCDSEYECKECNGDWVTYVPGKFTVEFKDGHAVMIGEAYLMPRYVKWLIDASETLGVSTVTHVRAEVREEEEKEFGSEEPRNVKRPYYQEFRVWPMRIGIMPLRHEIGKPLDGHEIHVLGNYA